MPLKIADSYPMYKFEEDISALVSGRKKDRVLRGSLAL